jgi:hypothetical protein
LNRRSAFGGFYRANDEAHVVQVLLAGRYCDRFEKRNDQWRVAERVVVYDPPCWPN